MTGAGPPVEGPPAEGPPAEGPPDMMDSMRAMQCNPCMKAMLTMTSPCEKAATCTSISIDMLCNSMFSDECVNDPSLMGMMMGGDMAEDNENSGDLDSGDEGDDGVEDNENRGDVDSEDGCT